MSLKGIILELRGMREGIGIISKRGEGKHWRCRTRSHTAIAPDQPSSFTQFDQQSPLPIHFYQQSLPSNLPPELLLDIIRRVEESETTWPARAVVLFCASVCRSWREITKEIVKTPEQCGRLTFPISLKQPGPREAPIQCFLKRDRVTSTYFLYFGLVPSEGGRDKLLLAARRFRRTTCTEFVISLAADEFSRDSNTCVGRLRSNFLGTKFSIYDNQPICDAAVQLNNRSSRKYHSKQVCPRVPTCNYNVASIEYELNVIRTRGPRKLQCWIHSIPFSSILEGGTVPTPMSPHSHFFTEQLSSPPNSKGYKSSTNLSSTSSPESSISVHGTKKPLHLKNKAPRWHEQLQCWCLNFKGRVTVASVKNFQLVATPDPSDNVPEEVLEKVILQFGKIGKDIFTMDYHYPLSAFQAFAICLSSFDTKPACE